MFASKDLAFSRPSGYQISRSVRLRSGASGYFNRTPATASNRTTFTFSFWNKFGLLSNSTFFFGADDGTLYSQFAINASNQIYFGYIPNTGGTVYQIGTSAVLRDPSAWYHIEFAIDTTQATNTNRIKIYVNNVQQTLTDLTGFGYPPQNSATQINQNVSSMIGRFIRGANNQYDGYLTEVNFIDGQALTPSSFGQYNANGVWSPIKYAGTYGTNGFYLNFSDNSAATATTIGKDNSGNGNNWTPNNISVTAGATYDSMIDVPTNYADGGNGRGNYCVLNPLDFNSGTVSNGNLQWVTSSGVGNGCFGTFAFDIANSTNKYYWEMTLTSGDVVFGIVPLTTLPSNTSRTGSYSYYTNGSKYSGTSATAYGASFTSGDVIGVTVGAGIITFYKNGTSQGSAFTGLTGFFKPAIWEVSGTFNANFGQRPFTYAPPTGFVALNTQNLSTPTIANGAAYMAATLYTGNGSTQSITNTVNGISFQPDLVWYKDRSVARDHSLFDLIRGTSQGLSSNLTNAENTYSGVTAFNSNGFSLGSSINGNASTETYVGWQWKAGGTSSSNTSGSITSTVSAGATQGFSVVTYTGVGGLSTVGHGLGVAPSMVIVMPRSFVSDKYVYHASIGAANFLSINLTSASAATALWNSTSPTSTVFTVNGNGANQSTSTFVAYCFAAVAGYSAFGSYTGNGSADGPFVHLGFRPKFVMIKRTDTTGNWLILDTSRNTYNVVNAMLNPNLSDAEATGVAGTNNWDFLSNGFKPRGTGALTNASGGTYIYMAFAENPFKYSLAR
jgi:hypothetical protein